MTSDEAKEVAIAVQSWLDFQAACERDTLLSEHFLRQPFFEALRARHTHKIAAEHDHPYLVNAAAGRNKQVDFALHSRGTQTVDPRVTTAFEVQWSDGSEQHQGVTDDLLGQEHYRRTGAAANGQLQLQTKVQEACTSRGGLVTEPSSQWFAILIELQVQNHSQTVVV